MSDSHNPTVKLSLRSFESKIYYMNGMYSLPVASFPQVDAAVKWQCAQNGVKHADKEALLIRLAALKKILQDELDEMDDISAKLRNNLYDGSLDFLTDIADLMGDLIVYCASEMVRFGIPPMDTLDIIMNSNFSKLDADGKPIIKDGKFEKGPFYWKPEPSIRAMLDMRAQEYLAYMQNIGWNKE